MKVSASLTDRIEIPTSGPITATVRPPGSKSITNRALIVAALANGTSTLSGALHSEDTEVMIDSLNRLGIQTTHDLDSQTILVQGCNGKIPATEADLFIANSGTTVRFLTAMVSIGKGNYRLDGIPRMRERPIADLLTALNNLGSNATSELETGCPPVVVSGEGISGGLTEIAGYISSQYLSGLLMAAPYAKHSAQIRVTGELVSKPYILITTAVMRAFGVDIEDKDLSLFEIPNTLKYEARQYNIEPDASAASYFWGAAAITQGTITVTGLSKNSLQGDVKFCEVLEKMGCRVDYHEDAISVQGGQLKGIEVDMNSISDTVQTLAAVALFAEGPTTITGVAHNRHKETDRIGDLACELRKLGATVDEFEDGLRIIPCKLKAAEIETYNDHRMAMSLALVGLKQPGVVILNPDCTKKTYPGFFTDLKAILVN